MRRPYSEDDEFFGGVHKRADGLGTAYGIGGEDRLDTQDWSDRDVQLWILEGTFQLAFPVRSFAG